jgi:hypothetical protein
MDYEEIRFYFTWNKLKRIDKMTKQPNTGHVVSEPTYEYSSCGTGSTPANLVVESSLLMLRIREVSESNSAQKTIYTLR